MNKDTLHTGGPQNKMTANLSSKIKKHRKQWNDIFKVLYKHERVNPELYICGKYLLKIRINLRHLQIYKRWKSLMSAHLHNKQCQRIIHLEANDNRWKHRFIETQGEWQICGSI